MDFKRKIKEIVSTSNLIRFILVIDDKGELIHSKIVTKSFLLKAEYAQTLATDMVILKKLLKLYDEIIGENTFVHLIREKVHVLIFFVENLTFLVSCERTANRAQIAEVADKIEAIIEMKS